MKRLSLVTVFFVFVFNVPVFGQNPIRLDFSGATAEANQVTLMGAGFGAYPQADVTFGAIPTDSAFEDATDGKGMIIQADPGEGVMVLTQSIQTTNCALIRCSVRASSSHASVYLASVDQGASTFVSTITPSNSALFVNQYKRLADFFLPPSTGFQGIIQVTNTSTTEKLTVYLDNLEILILGKDNIDLAVTEITGKQSIPVATPTPFPPTPTNTPTPNSVSKTITIDLALPDGAKPLDMVLIPAGTFTMGSPSTEQSRILNEGPQHQVIISQPFYLGKYEITQAQWKAVMNDIPSYFGYNPNYPVEQVSWDDCQTFIGKLNQMRQGTYRLPTEAEWEYACRVGTTTAFYWGDDTDYRQIKQYAWYYNNSGSQTHEVGTKLPNLWGLYDMSGNVFEWIQDWCESYSSSVQTDPTGALSGSSRVIRGGSWYSYAEGSRSANRASTVPDYRHYGLGFRLQKSYDGSILPLPSHTPVPNCTPTPVPSTPTPSNTPTPDSVNETITINLVLPDGAKPLKMVLIPAGSFMMGDSTTNSQKQVIISQPFYIGKFELTQAQWQAVMSSNPSYFIGNNLPVDQVSWNDCQTFIQKLNQLGQGSFRLPTEAEWEYACRVQTTTAFYWGDDINYNQIDQYSWYESNANNQPHEVGTKLPNAFGLYDMSGNVLEWCQDYWYEDSAGTSSPLGRVCRSGCWGAPAVVCCSAFRGFSWPDSRSIALGFRLQRSYP